VGHDVSFVQDKHSKSTKNVLRGTALPTAPQSSRQARQSRSGGSF
jgi:dTDP-4-dehydrorhamnose 3,5-epimerase-like enzyme